MPYFNQQFYIMLYVYVLFVIVVVVVVYVFFDMSFQENVKKRVFLF